MEHSVKGNYREFLLAYNQMTEKCFHRCVTNFNTRSLDEDESSCVQKCVLKLIKINHKLMTLYALNRQETVNASLEANKSISESTDIEEISAS